MIGMMEDQKQDGVEVARFPFEEIEIRVCRTPEESQALIDKYVAEGGTGETLLAQINASKSPILMALLFADHHLPILRLIPDFSEFAKPAMYCAVANSAHRLVDLLIERGADLYAKMDGIPPMVATAFDGGVTSIACSKHLLRAGVDIDAATDDGVTALMRAAGEGRVEIVRHLIEAGADVSRRDGSGCTALHWALGYGSITLGQASQSGACVEAARLLLEAGAAADARDFHRRTPMHFLTSAPGGLDAVHSSAAIDLLLHHGADIEARKDGRLTPLLTAAKNPNRGGFLIEQLHRVGADMNVKDDEGRTIDRLVTGDGPRRALRAIRMGQSLESAMSGESAESANRGGGFAPL